MQTDDTQHGPLYSMDDLFRCWIVTKELQLYHPKKFAIHSELEKLRKAVDEAPLGSMSISLPIVVQADTSTWNKTVTKRDDVP